MPKHRRTRFGLLVVVLALTTRVLAESGYAAWLRYQRIEEGATAQRYADIPKTLFLASDSPVLESAKTELLRALHGMLGLELKVTRQLPDEPAIVLGTLDPIRRLFPELKVPEIETDGFWLKRIPRKQGAHLIVMG